MLRQAAAMLIPFPAAIATYGCRSTLPFGFELGTLAGSAVSVLGLAIGVVRSRRTFAGDR